VDPKRIVVDPGIGFGKRREQNSELIARLGEIAALDLPVLVGPSRKQFLAQDSEGATELATAGAVTACILNGASIVRIHDVKAMMPAIQVADAIVAARREPEIEEPKKDKERRSSPEQRVREEQERRGPARPPRPGPRPSR
jgi:dihydropteroate synthase